MSEKELDTLEDVGMSARGVLDDEELRAVYGAKKCGFYKPPSIEERCHIDYGGSWSWEHVADDYPDVQGPDSCSFW